jgi:CHASE2 domain-containing sensor protein
MSSNPNRVHQLMEALAAARARLLKLWKPGAILVLVGVVHFVASFFAWALHPGHTASGKGSAIGWTILSFPLFYVVPERFLNADFEVWLPVNSLLWAVAAVAAWTWRRRRSRSSSPS